jgi:hypothetical protein
VNEVVIAYRPRDKNIRGTEIVFELGQRLAAGAVQGVEMTSFRWPLENGAARYQLVGESIDVDSLEPELDDIDANWRDHVELAA